MMTMENEWREFAARHFYGMHGSVPQIQFDETKKTFYATMGHALIKLRDDVSKLPENEGAAQLEALLQEIAAFLKSAQTDWEKAKPAFRPDDDLKADRTTVFDMMDHLRRSLEEFINTYHKPVGHIDAFMGAHNFHKLVIRDLMDRNGITGPARVLFLRMAMDTFTKWCVQEIEATEAAAGVV